MFFNKGLGSSFKAGMLAVMLLVISNAGLCMTMVEYGDGLTLTKEEHAKYELFFMNVDEQLKKVDYKERLNKVAKMMNQSSDRIVVILTTNLMGGLVGESGTAYGDYEDKNRYPDDPANEQKIFNGVSNGVHKSFRPYIMKNINIVAEGLTKCDVINGKATKEEIDAAITYCNGCNSLIAQGLSCIPDFEKLGEFLDKNKLGLSTSVWGSNGYEVIIDSHFLNLFSTLVYIYREGLLTKKSFGDILTFVGPVAETKSAIEGVLLVNEKSADTDTNDLDLLNTDVGAAIGGIKGELVRHIERFGDLKQLSEGFAFIYGGKKIIQSSILKIASLFHLFAKSDVSYKHKNEYRFAYQTIVSYTFGGNIPGSLDVGVSQLSLLAGYDPATKFDSSYLYFDFNQCLTSMTGAGTPDALYNYENEALLEADKEGCSMQLVMAKQALLNFKKSKFDSAFLVK